MADNAAQSIKDLSKDVEILDQRIAKSIELLKGFDAGIADLFEEARKKGIANTDQLVDYLAKKLNNLQIKTVVSPFLGAFDEKEIDKAAKRYAALLEKQDVVEKARSIAVGGRKFGELQGEDLKNWREFSALLATINEQKRQIEQATPGSAEAGQKLYNEQLAFQKAQEMQSQERKRIAQEEAEVKRKAAEDERKLNELIAEEERKKTEAAKQKYKEAIEANKALTKAEDDLAKSRREQRTAESKDAYKDYFSKQLNAQKQADRESMNIQRRQIQIKAEMAAIDKKRATEGKQLTSEEKARYREISAELTKLIARQKELDSISQGSGKRARGRLSNYEITEAEKAMRRYGNAVQDARNKQQGLNNETSKMLPTIQRLASAFGIAFSVRGLAQFGKKLIETRGEFERQQVALRSILQNKQLADEIWDKTMQAALQSPFTAMQLTTYTKQLAAYRIETDKLFDTTKRLADISAGLGVDMQRLILAYGQVKAANYLRASEIRQFTEAGVNVLGELRDYFNEVKGMSVDTAKVMEMVTKRLVTFEDVEAIFKRMTDEGGIFYEMQYVQSQTVRGQIAKLHDAYDQMLNSIGQANEGVLKKLVSLLNNIIKNWREWKTVIDLIAWPLIISALYKFALGLVAVDAAAVATATSMNGMTVAGAKLQVVLKKLWVTVMSNPWLALATAILAAGVAARNHAKNVEAINKKYEELMLRVYETQKNLDGLSETIQNNLDTMKKATKGSEEYNEANRKNENIVKKLKEQYPDLLKDIDLQKDGYEKLIERIKEYNEELEYQIKLEYAARASFWQDDLTTNIAELQEFQNKREMQFLKNRELAEQRYLALKAQGKEAEEDFWNKRMRLAKDWQEQVEIINEQNEQIYKEQERARSSATEGIVFSGNWSLQSQGFVIPNAGNFWGANVEKQKQNLKKNIQDEALVFNEIIREQLKNINEDLGEDIEQFISDNKTQVEELFKDKEGEGWKILNKQITRFFTAKGATDKETRKVIQEYLNQFLHIPIQLDWSNAGGASSTSTPTPETSGNKTSENASKLISLIKEMRSEYDKLSKSAYGYAKSEEKVREAYRDSVKAILGKTGVTEDYDFTTNEGMIAALDKVLAYANKLGPEAAAEVQKYIDQLETEIEINAQVKIRKDFGKQIEEMFSNYDLTIDLEKLNVPTDELVGIFNLDVTTLDELRRFVDDFYNKQIELGNNPTELVEQVEGYYKKIDEMEKKELRERLKTYSKYLAEGQVEALKIHLEELKKMAELDKLYEQGYFTDTQYKDISNKIRKETDEKLAKNDWQQFKESDFYVTMFEDMSRVSSESIDIMIKRLKSLRKSVNDLNPKQAKEIVKAIEKLEKAKLERSPLKSFLEDWKTAAKWRKDNDNLVKQLGFYASGDEYWSKEQDKQSKRVAELRLEYEELVKNGTPEDAADVKERLDFEEEELSRINEILEDRRQKLDQINQEQNEGYGAQQRVLAGLAQGAQYFSDLASTAGTISTEIMDMFDGVSDASKKLAKDIAEIAANVGILAGDIVKAIASEGTDVGSMIDGLVRTWNIIKGIFSASEYEINYTIEKSTNALKDLEFELERVRRARERAWDTHAYVAAQNELENNIYAQIRAYDAMLAAEEERKNKDEEQIRTWKQEREELFEQLEDERETLLKDFGGIGESEYRSAAEGFVDAWKSAFLETGDGLQGLQDHFDEFLNEWFVKQATMRVAGKMLEPLFRDIDNAVDKYSGGGTSVMMSELAKIRERFGIIAPQLSDTLEELSGLWGIGGEGGLSGLAAGIQGMPEEQANVLEAYWNSVRGYTANIDMNVSRIAQILGAGGDNTNPMLAQMTLVAQNTTAIRKLLDSVRFNGGDGDGIRVYSF